MSLLWGIFFFACYKTIVRKLLFNISSGINRYITEFFENFGILFLVWFKTRLKEKSF